MSLSDIWRIVRGPNDLVPFWVERRFDSPLATAGGPDADGNDAVSAVTLRTRFRTDIGTNTTLTDDQGRVWSVQEVLEVGRRRWLDMSCATYALEAGDVIPDPTPTGDPSPPGFTPPSGWGIMQGDDAVSTVQIASVSTHDSHGGQQGIFWQGRFAAIENVTGTVDPAQLDPVTTGIEPSIAAKLPADRGGFIVVWNPAADGTDWRDYNYLEVTGHTAVLQGGYLRRTIQTRANFPIFIGDEFVLLNQTEYTTCFGDVF